MIKHVISCCLICFAITANAQTKPVVKIDTTVYTAVEIPPKPRGGEGALGLYVMKYLRYPGKLRDEDVGKHTVMKWVVEKDGSLSNFMVVRGASAELGKEPIRVFKSMPKWSPGMQNGRRVRVQYIYAGYLELGMDEM